MKRHEQSGNSGRRVQTMLSLIGDVTNVVPRLAQSLDTLGAIAGFRRWCNRNKMGPRFRTREALWKSQFLPHLVAITDPILIAEFGVAFGEATRWWLGQLDTAAVAYHGFDRFTGLPSGWRNHSSGDFDAGGVPPAIDDARVTWHVGDVENTIGQVDWGGIDARRLILFDLDLFAPSLVAWNVVKHHLRPGDLLWFDEAFDADERILLDAVILPSISIRGLGHSPFGVALQVV